MTVRPMIRADLGWALALNALHETELSPLTREKLTAMHGEAFLALVADPEAGILLTFDQDDDYDSPNFLWFRERYDRFVYVDRIAVAVEHRRQGHAEALYETFFEAARAAGHRLAACEVNLHPPNPVSHRFHEALGFRPVDETPPGDGKGGGKRVRYYIRDLP